MHLSHLSAKLRYVSSRIWVHPEQSSVKKSGRFHTAVKKVIHPNRWFFNKAASPSSSANQFQYQDNFSSTSNHLTVHLTGASSADSKRLSVTSELFQENELLAEGYTRSKNSLTANIDKQCSRFQTQASDSGKLKKSVSFGCTTTVFYVKGTAPGDKVESSCPIVESLLESDNCSPGRSVIESTSSESVTKTDSDADHDCADYVAVWSFESEESLSDLLLAYEDQCEKKSGLIPYAGESLSEKEIKEVLASTTLECNQGTSNENTSSSLTAKTTEDILVVSPSASKEYSSEDSCGAIAKRDGCQTISVLLDDSEEVSTDRGILCEIPIVCTRSLDETIQDVSSALKALEEENEGKEELSESALSKDWLARRNHQSQSERLTKISNYKLAMKLLRHLERDLQKAYKTQRQIPNAKALKFWLQYGTSNIAEIDKDLFTRIEQDATLLEMLWIANGIPDDFDSKVHSILKDSMMALEWHLSIVSMFQENGYTHDSIIKVNDRTRNLSWADDNFDTAELQSLPKKSLKVINKPLERVKRMY